MSRKLSISYDRFLEELASAVNTVVDEYTEDQLDLDFWKVDSEIEDIEIVLSGLAGSIESLKSQIEDLKSDAF